MKNVLESVFKNVGWFLLNLWKTWSRTFDFNTLAFNSFLKTTSNIFYSANSSNVICTVNFDKCLQLIVSPWTGTSDLVALTAVVYSWEIRHSAKLLNTQLSGGHFSLQSEQILFT